MEMKKAPEIPAIYTACGGLINDAERYPSAVFQGQVIYFCEEACRRVFLKDPQRFLAGEVDHFEDEG